jgi:hypothetical protein
MDFLQRNAWAFAVANTVGLGVMIYTTWSSLRKKSYAEALHYLENKRGEWYVNMLVCTELNDVLMSDADALRKNQSQDQNVFRGRARYRYADTSEGESCEEEDSEEESCEDDNAEEGSEEEGSEDDNDGDEFTNLSPQ